MKNIALLIQARLGSSRFPRKVLAPFCGVPMLAYQVQHFQQAGWEPQVLIPTGDIALLELRAYGVAIQEVHGKPQDVLGRFARYAKAFLSPGAVIVRICGDCPLLCPVLLTALLAHWDATPGLAYLGMGPGWPDGLADYDLFTREALLEIDAEATIPSDREHIVPFFWRYPEHFPQALFEAPAWVRGRTWPKLSIDTPDDLVYAEQVVRQVQQDCGPEYTWINVLSTLAVTPALDRVSEPMNAAYMAQVAQEQGHPALTWEESRFGLDSRSSSVGESARRGNCYLY